jgi:hypothetical protein
VLSDPMEYTFSTIDSVRLGGATSDWLAVTPILFFIMMNNLKILSAGNTGI